MGILIGFLFTLYFLPSLLAWSMKHKDVNAITVLNMLLGWTFIGWVIAMIWAVKK